MSRIQADASLHEKLAAVTQPVELVDGRGNVMGRYVPTRANISEEELQRRERLGGGRSLAEIMTDLENRK